MSRNWIIYVLAIVVCLNPLCLQGANVDSLLVLAETLTPSREKVEVLIELSDVHIYSSPQKSQKYLEEGIQIAEEMEDEFWMGKLYQKLGTCHYFQADYPKAIETILLSVDHFKVQDDLENQIQSYNTLFGAYYMMGNFEQAEAVLLTGREALKNHPDKFSPDAFRNQTIRNNANLALIWTDQERYEEAMQLHLENLDSYGEEEYHRRGLTLHNIGYLFEKKGQFKEALKYYQDSYEIELQGDNTDGTGHSLIKMVDMLAELGRFDEAKTWMDSVWQFPGTSESPFLLGMAHRAYARIAKVEGDLEIALQRTERYMEIRDSMLTAQQNSEIAALQHEIDDLTQDTEMQLLLKDKELKEVRESRRTLMLWIFGIGFAVLVIGVGFLAWLVVGRNQALKAARQSNEVIQENLLTKRTMVKHLEKVIKKH